MREIKEETGLTNVRILLPVHTSMWDPSYRRYSVIYLARAIGKEEVRPDTNEAAGYRWASWEECEAAEVGLAAIKANPNAKLMIGRQMLTGIQKARVLWAIPAVRDLNLPTK